MRKFSAFIIVLLISLGAIAQERDPLSLPELEERIARLQEVNEIPAIGLALIDRHGNTLARSFGLANIENHIPATGNSLFRLGSISKMFVALAILKLRDEGKLELSDRLRDLAPEVAFENKWEDEYPVRIRDLLNHTTGWDDFHGPEWITSDPTPLTTKEALELHPHTRSSRWPPGTRMAYSNAGAPVAAYVVEKLTGMAFEAYIQQQFFKPMGLHNTTFFYSKAFRELGVTNYKNGIATSYYHLSGRAAGALNSSPEELLPLLDFFLNRGQSDSAVIISAPSIEQMEHDFPDFGLTSGYGLCNFTSYYKGIEFKGHNGAVDNALATFYYSPEHKIGYALMMSTMNNRDFRKLNELVTNYLIQDLETPGPEIVSDATGHNAEIEGFYYLANPRNQQFRVIQNLFEPAKVSWQNDTLSFGPAFGDQQQKYIPVAKNTYASILNPHLKIHLKEDYDGSLILHKAVFGGAHSFKPINGLLVYGKIIIFILALLLSFTTIIIGAIQFIRLLVGSLKISGNTGLALGPGLSSMVFLPFVVLFLYVMNNPFDYLFSQNGLTILVYILSLIYGLSVIWSVLFFGRSRQLIIKDAMNIYLAIVAFVHLLMAAYLFTQDMIGIQTWS